MNAKNYVLTVTGNTGFDPTAPNYRAYASSLKAQGVNCVYTGFNPPGEVELVKDINGALPTAKVFGGDGVCSGGETNPKTPIAISSQPYNAAGRTLRSARRPSNQAPRPRPPM